MIFTRTGGTADANAPHAITFTANFETAGQHQAILNGSDLSNNADVSSVSTDPVDALVDGTIYDITLAYQDLMGNTAASVVNSGFNYGTDVTTITPTLTAPMDSTFENVTIALDFTFAGSFRWSCSRYSCRQSSLPTTGQPISTTARAAASRTSRCRRRLPKVGSGGPRIVRIKPGRDRPNGTDGTSTTISRTA